MVAQRPPDFSCKQLVLLAMMLTMLLFMTCATKLKCCEKTLNDKENCTETGFFGSNTDCNIFYRCVEVEDPEMANTSLHKFTFECPPGLIFDKNISSCNRESDVNPKPTCFDTQTEQPEKPHYPNKFIVTGSKYGIVYFQYNRSNINFDEIEGVELENVIVDPAILTNFLSLTTKLKSLILRNVQLIADFEDRVALPNLEVFYLSHVNLIKSPFPFLQQNESSQINDFRTYKAMFQSLIFFYKDDWSWKIENISKLKTDIEVLVHNSLLFKLNWRDNQIISRLEFTDDIISNWDPEGLPLEKLTLINCPLSIYSAPNTLKYIDFEHVTYRNGSLTDILRKNKGLKYVQVVFKNHSKIYLSDLSKKIEHLRISNGIIVKSLNPWFPFPSGSYELHVEFQHLDKVFFGRCIIEEDVIRDFSAIFKTKAVAISSNEQIQHHTLLKEILKGSADKLNWIGMLDFGRNPANPPTSYNEIEQFLTNSGVQQNQTVFVIEKKDGVWFGKNTNAIGDFEFQQI